MKTIYWQRRNQFPAMSIGDVRVVTGERWDAPPLERDEPHDLGWHRIDLDDEGIESGIAVGEVNDTLGLCGDLGDTVLVMDAVSIAAAIFAEIGLDPGVPHDPVYDCPWKPSSLANGGTDAAPSDDYQELQCFCALMRAELADALRERHGVEIASLMNN
jgi:hypothetical protein